MTEIAALLGRRIEIIANRVHPGLVDILVIEDDPRGGVKATVATINQAALWTLILESVKLVTAR